MRWIACYVYRTYTSALPLHPLTYHASNVCHNETESCRGWLLFMIILINILTCSIDDIMFRVLKYWNGMRDSEVSVHTVLFFFSVTVNSPYKKGKWRRALMFPLTCAGTNGWVNNQYTCDLRRHSAGSLWCNCNVLTPPWHVSHLQVSCRNPVTFSIILYQLWNIFIKVTTIHCRGKAKYPLSFCRIKKCPKRSCYVSHKMRYGKKHRRLIQMRKLSC